jgi:hypothetical protein
MLSFRANTPDPSRGGIEPSGKIGRLLQRKRGKLLANPTNLSRQESQENRLE